MFECMSIPSIDKTDVAVYLDEPNRRVHVLDLALGRTSLTNSIDLIQEEILRRMGAADTNAQSWEWYLYHTDGAITRYGKRQFLKLTPDNDVLYALFVETVGKRDGREEYELFDY